MEGKVEHSQGLFATEDPCWNEEANLRDIEEQDTKKPHKNENH
jgi:hypothetical protein